MHCVIRLNPGSEAEEQIRSLWQPQDLPRAVELAFGAPLPRQVRVRGFDVVECGETTSKSPGTYAFSK